MSGEPMERAEMRGLLEVGELEAQIGPVPFELLGPG